MRFLRQLVRQIRQSASRPWYLPFIASLAALDAFILVIANEAFLIPGVIAQPRQWKAFGFWLAFGSACGATAFGLVTSYYGESFLAAFLPELSQSDSWTLSEAWMRHYGVWAIAFIAASPIPQHPVVAMAALSQLPPLSIFLAVMLGRSLKYVTLAWLTMRSTRLLEKRFLP